MRGVLAGMAAVGLAFTNLPLLAVSLVAFALAPVPYLGLALVPWTMTLVRMRADLERRRASRTGVLVTRPYHPPPHRAVAGGWQRFRWTVTDPLIHDGEHGINYDEYVFTKRTATAQRIAHTVDRPAARSWSVGARVSGTTGSRRCQPSVATRRRRTVEG